MPSFLTRCTPGGYPFDYWNGPGCCPVTRWYGSVRQSPHFPGATTLVTRPRVACICSRHDYRENTLVNLHPTHDIKPQMAAHKPMTRGWTGTHS